MSQWSKGVTDAQTVLIDILRQWASASHPGAVHRNAFDPGPVRQFLSNLSVLDLGRDRNPAFRYVGSAIPGLMGLRATPMSLADVPENMVRAWQACTTLNALECGLYPAADRQAVHVWMRVPMVNNEGEIKEILCHDMLAPLADRDQTTSKSDCIHGEDIVLAA